MWCSTCQQDVPGLGSPSGEGDLRCGKCGGGLSGGKPAAAATACAASAAGTFRSPPALDDDWALEAELRGVERLMQSLKSRSPLAESSIVQNSMQQAAANWHSAQSGHAPCADATRSQKLVTARDKGIQPRSHAAAWCILSLGLAVFACGAVLLGWSLFAKRDDLWPVGMPLALIGQAGLVLGLVLQLDGLWHSNRRTADVLSELDGELKDVRQATSLLSTTHSSGAQSFYFHLAEGASPQMLLADLKGQIDLLAQQMARNAKC
jgi:hypothetical protein